MAITVGMEMDFSVPPFIDGCSIINQPFLDTSIDIRAWVSQRVEVDFRWFKLRISAAKTWENMRKIGGIEDKSAWAGYGVSSLKTLQMEDKPSLDHRILWEIHPITLKKANISGFLLSPPREWFRSFYRYTVSVAMFLLPKTNKMFIAIGGSCFLQ